MHLKHKHKGLSHNRLAVLQNSCDVEYLFVSRIPTLQELGVQERLYSNADWVGGESEALRKLVVYCIARKQPHSNYVSTMISDIKNMSCICMYTYVRACTCKCTCLHVILAHIYM